MENVALIVSVLGGQKSLGRRVRNALDFVDLIKDGIPFLSARRLKERYTLNNHEFAGILGLSERTLTRLSGKSEAVLLPVPASDRLFRMARIISIAEEVFEDRKLATGWLRRFERFEGGADRCDRRPLC